MSAALEQRSNGRHGLTARPKGRTSAQRVDRRKHCVVIRVEGELDAAVHPEFRAALERAIRTDCDAVVVDLRAVRFLSIRAALTLGAVRRQVADGGPEIRIVAGRGEVERALVISGTRALFADFPSMRAALDT